MAFGEITGRTVDGIDDLREEYRQSRKFKSTDIPFDVAYCLNKIGKQPDDYEGPQRFCANRVSRPDDGSHAPNCNFHGGKGNAGGTPENLETLAATKHGMYSSIEHLKEVFTEQDQKLYDFVMSWADAYDWPSREEDPSRYDDLETIAVNRVRVARSNKYLLEEGELKRQEVYDENGNLLEQDNQHALSEDLRLKRKLILDIKKELGLTPKERSRMDTNEKSAGAAEQIAEVASQAVLDNSGEYDPDSELYEE
jgi:hypothetical protein